MSLGHEKPSRMSKHHIPTHHTACQLSSHPNLIPDQNVIPHSHPRFKRGPVQLF